MSGGKGGSKTTETTIPDWIKDPAIRNLQRAEDVQRIEYMPYYGADVAAFTPTQNAAFDANIGAAESFGLLAPNTLTATSGMPTPTDFDGFTGYSSQPMYESALAELKANQPDAVAQYDALFGSNVPTTWGGGGGGGFRGSANVNNNTTTPENRWVDKASHIMDTGDKERDRGTAEESGVKQAQDAYNAAVAAGTNWDKPRPYTPAEAKLYEDRAKKHTDTQGTIMSWPQKPKIVTRKGGNPLGYGNTVTKKGSNPLGYGNPNSSGGLTSRLDSKGATPTPVSRPIDEIVAGYRSKK